MKTGLLAAGAALTAAVWVFSSNAAGISVDTRIPAGCVKVVELPARAMQAVFPAARHRHGIWRYECELQRAETNGDWRTLARLRPLGDFHLPDDSKCHGRGLYADWMRKTTDLDGKRRAPGGVVDIGCYRVGRNGFMLLVR